MLLITIILCLTAVYIWKPLERMYRRRLRRRILDKITMPPGHWLIGNMDLLLKNPSRSKIFNILRKFAENYGPIYRLSTPYVVTVNILHPGDFEIVLSQKKHLNKSKLYQFLKDWLGEGLLTSAETAMGISGLDEQSQITYRKSVYKMGQFLLNRVLNPLKNFKFLYSLSKDSREEKMTISNLHDFTYGVIKEREKQILNEDYEELVPSSYSGKKLMRMLDLLLFAKNNDKSIDVEGIREEVDTFMFGGHDTTSSALTFILYSMAKHPDIQKLVRNEIKEVLGSKNMPSYDDLQKLSYTERVIKECLRLYPSVPFISRIASEDFVTHTGYLIPRGAILQLHIFDLHRDPKIYPNPLKFDPDRFLPENCKNRHPFAYLPFSAGPRNCIGQKFAMMELKTVVCGIVSRFKLENGTEDLRFFLDLVLRTQNEMKIKFVPIN